MIPHYKESPLVQKAINDMEKYLNEKHEKVQETKQTVEVKQEVQKHQSRKNPDQWNRTGHKRKSRQRAKKGN